MSSEAEQNQLEVQDINKRFMRDEITADEAMDLVKPVVKRINKRAREIAAKHGIKTARTVKAQISKSYGLEVR